MAPSLWSLTQPLTFARMNACMLPIFKANVWSIKNLTITVYKVVYCNGQVFYGSDVRWNWCKRDTYFRSPPWNLIITAPFRQPSTLDSFFEIWFNQNSYYPKSFWIKRVLRCVYGTIACMPSPHYLVHSLFGWELGQLVFIAKKGV